MSHLCVRCGETCLPITDTKLGDWEMRELQKRAGHVIAEYPPIKGRPGVARAARQSHLKALADEYGINIRTLYRYMRRAA